jgi:hypothetical protein
VQTVASDGATRSFFTTHSANVVGELPRAEVARLLSAGPTCGGGHAVRVAREVEHARELSFSDRERTQNHVKFVGDLLSGERSIGAEQAANASQRDDGARRPRLRPAAADNTEPGRVGEHLPGGLGVGPSEAAGAVRGDQRGARSPGAQSSLSDGGWALTGANIGDRREPLPHGCLWPDSP